MTSKHRYFPGTPGADAMAHAVTLDNAIGTKRTYRNVRPIMMESFIGGKCYAADSATGLDVTLTTDGKGWVVVTTREGRTLFSGRSDGGAGVL